MIVAAMHIPWARPERRPPEIRGKAPVGNQSPSRREIKPGIFPALAVSDGTRALVGAREAWAFSAIGAGVKSGDSARIGRGAVTYF